MTRAVDHEGVLIARWFQERGVAGFILRYRIRPTYTTDESLLDAERGLRYLHAHAADLHIDPARIGLIGFSAGATLASNAAIRANSGRSDAKDPVDRASSRAAFQVLAYGSPGLLGMTASEGSSSRKPLDLTAAPPTFLFGTNEDAAQIVKGMAELYADLTRANVPVEAHFFAHGVHGVGFAQGDPVLGTWPGLMWNWLRASGLLTGAHRVAIRGVVTIDGEPLRGGTSSSRRWTTTLPRRPPPTSSTPARPGASSRCRRARADPRTLPRRGPPGRRPLDEQLARSGHVQHDAKAKNRTLTADERREWVAYARKRDLSPSVTEQRAYRSKDGHGKTDWIVEIKSGGENRLDLEVSTK